VYGDLISEYNETVVLTIDSTVNANRGDPYIYELTITDDDDNPIVTFDQPSQTAYEDWPAIIVRVNVEPNPSGKEIQVPFTVSGTALPLNDYYPPASPLLIPPGANYADILIPLIDDTNYDPNEMLVVTMGAPVDAIPGAITQHTIMITDNDSPPSVSFIAESQTAAETVGTILITTQLKDSSGNEVVAGQAVSVPFTVSGTATESIDYTRSPDPLVIPVGSSRADIVIYLTNDGVAEPDETIVVSMGTPVNAMQGSPSTHTITITSDPIVFFLQAAQSIHETSAGVDIEVVLLPVQNVDVSVPFVIGGTAVEGEDYIREQNSPLYIPAGQSQGYISFTMIEDGVDELDETLTIVLGPPASATLGSPNEHVLTILDDNPPPAITFTQPEQSVAEEDVSVSFQLQLTHPSSQPISVLLSLGGSATQGSDYHFEQTSVDFEPGTTSAYLTLQVTDDTLQESFETIVIALEQPIHSILGTPNTHTITILTNDQPTCNIFDDHEVIFYQDQIALGWSLSNLGTDTLILKELSISWPTGAPNSPKFDKVYFNSNLIFDGNEPHSPSTITSWMGYDSYRQLASTTSMVNLKFTRTFDPGDYTLALVFRNVTRNIDCTPVIVIGTMQ
jgi:hypothetical protein